VLDEDGSRYVRSFGLNLLARFEDGESGGRVHATMVRPFTRLDDQGLMENGRFWGIVEFLDDVRADLLARLIHGERFRLEDDPSQGPQLPLTSLVVHPVRDIRGGQAGWLVEEVWDSPYLEEFLRRLRLNAPGAELQIMTDGAATITWHEEGRDIPLAVATTEGDLAAAVAEIGSSSRDALWPSSTVDDAGFNLLIVHLEEVIATRDVSRGLQIGRAGLTWPDRRNDE
jgi:hypothetical protein